jgi:nucleotide-binding universal stress UspA family protein
VAAYGRILAALTGGPEDGGVLRQAAALAWETNARVRLLYVLDTHALLPESVWAAPALVRHTLAAEAERVLAAAAQTLALAGVAAEREVREQRRGSVAAHIAGAAAEWHADLIVVGAPRHRLVARLFGPLHAEDVAHCSHRPVLIVDESPESAAPPGSPSAPDLPVPPNPAVPPHFGGLPVAG